MEAAREKAKEVRENGGQPLPSFNRDQTALPQEHCCPNQLETAMLSTIRSIGGTPTTIVANLNPKH